MGVWCKLVILAVLSYLSYLAALPGLCVRLNGMSMKEYFRRQTTIEGLFIIAGCVGFF